jgi:hypothetical protein
MKHKDKIVVQRMKGGSEYFDAYSSGNDHEPEVGPSSSLRQCVQIVGDLVEYERIRMTVDGMVAELEREVERFETAGCDDGSILPLLASVSAAAIAAAERILGTSGQTKLSLREVRALKICLSWYSTVIGDEETSSYAIQRRIHDALQSIIQSEVAYEASLVDAANETSMEKWHRMAYEDNIDIPDFVVDRHTKQGRTKGADKLSFALEGSKVEREYFGFLRLEEMRRVYVEIKKREDEDAEQQEKALVKPKGKKTEEISIDRLRSVIPVGEWTEEHEKAIALDSTYVGQVVCAKWKPQTYMIREGPLKGKIVKGPFALKEKMITLAGRVQGFKLMGCRTPDMIFMLDDQSRVWVQMTAFANRPVEEWQFELQMDNIVGKMVKTVRRSSLGSRQMMDKPMEEIREFMFGDYFLYGDYIIAAVFGCGDMGVWNCLAGDTEALIIDFDDSTTRTKIENAWDVFAKCPYKKHQEMFDMGMKTTIDRIRTVIASLQENRQKLLEIGAWREDYFEMVKKFYC